jgi:hypothetical protein
MVTPWLVPKSIRFPPRLTIGDGEGALPIGRRQPIFPAGEHIVDGIGREVQKRLFEIALFDDPAVAENMCDRNTAIRQCSADK